jgi:hypothetical protein
MSNPRKWLLTLFVALVASLSLPSLASASLHRPFPNGIDSSNAKHAWQQVSSRASVDPSYASKLASTAGASSFDPSDYKVVGYGKASSGTTNSATESGGATVPTADTPTCRVKARVLIVINKATGNEVEICTGCGNTRLRTRQPLVRQKWSVGTVLRFQKTKTVSRSCPAPFTYVKAKVRVTVKGTVRGRSWGYVYGKMKGRIRVRINAKVKAQLTLVCPKPTSPPVVVPPSQPTPPAPPAQPQDHAPGIQCIWPPHIYVNGVQALYCKMWDADGDKMSVSFVGDDYAYVSSPVSSNDYDGQPCPAGYTCIRAWLWARNTPTPEGTLSEQAAVVSANGQDGFSYGHFPVVKDDFAAKRQLERYAQSML